MGTKHIDNDFDDDFDDFDDEDAPGPPPSKFEVGTSSGSESRTVKPFWWGIVVGAMLFAGGALCGLPAIAYANGMLDVALNDSAEKVLVLILPATGFIAGFLLATSLLGHLPGRYEVTSGKDEGRSLTLWRPLSTLERIGYIAGGLGIVPAAIGLLLLTM